MKLLVIEDNPKMAGLIRQGLEEQGYLIEAAASGHDGEHQAASNPYDLVILDVMLPDMDGWDLLAALRSHPRAQDIPVIVCSVVRREELAETLQAARCLAKPVRRQQLLQALDQVLGSAPTVAPTVPVHNSTAC